MCKCDTCKVEAGIQNSGELGCCAWFLENVWANNKSVDTCPVYSPVDSLQKVTYKGDCRLTGYIVRWIGEDQFIAYVTNRYGTKGEMLCHKDSWWLT